MLSSPHTPHGGAGCDTEASLRGRRFGDLVRHRYKRILLSGSAIVILMSPLFLVKAYTQSAAMANDGVGKQKSTQAPDSHDETTREPGDPLGRDTPHGTLLGFLHAAQAGNYQLASQYLQLSNKQRTAKGETLAREYGRLMDQAFVGRIGAVSDDPEGSPQPGVPHDRERIGVLRIPSDETNVDLVRVSDPETGENVWLFSADTLAAASNLSEQMEESKLESELPRFLVVEIFSIPVWRWIAFLLLVPLALLLSLAFTGLLRSGIRVRLRKRPSQFLQDFSESLKSPGKLTLTVAFHWIGIGFLGLPLLFREFYRRFAGVALAVGLAWFVLNLINRWAERARLNALADSGYRSGSIILLGQRILTVVVVVIAGLIILSIFGFDMTTAIAGLGIGGIAIAFAAQKTLENLLGGISIIGDQVIRVGETCRLGEEIGTVEDISLRSTRIRTLDSAQLSVPNGQLANMNIKNLSRYARNSIRTTVLLQHGTTPDQLRSVLARMRALLQEDSRVDHEVARVRLTGFGESSLEVEIYCHILTGDWNEFLAIREDLLLRIMELIAEAGVQLALPSRTLHLAEKESSSQGRFPLLEQKTFKRKQGS